MTKNKMLSFFDEDDVICEIFFIKQELTRLEKVPCDDEQEKAIVDNKMILAIEYLDQLEEYYSTIVK